MPRAPGGPAERSGSSSRAEPSPSYDRQQRGVTGFAVGDEAREKAEDRIDQVRQVYDRHGTIFHVAWIAAAVLVIFAGLVMTVFPGPAMLVLPLGLAMLAVVFSWARRLLVFGADEGADAAHAWKDASTWIKVATVATAAAVVGAIGAWALL